MTPLFGGILMATGKALDAALCYIEEHYMEQVTLDDLMRVCGVSKYSLIRQFKKQFDIPPQKWIWIFRIFVAKQALSYWPQLSCRDVAFACGFETPAHFSRVFRDVVGETPQSYKRRIHSSEWCFDMGIYDDQTVAILAKRAFLNHERVRETAL